MSRELRVGLLVIVALALLSAGVFLIGERSHLFSRMNRYQVQFSSVGGLAVGSTVQLSGVTVGRVDEVVLPEEVDEELLTVWLTVDRRYADRIRQDSEARIKTLGLLGDKYVEITSGSASAAIILSDGRIPAAPTTDVDRLIASGEDAVANLVGISSSLRTILARMEAGEGILGELTVDTDAGRRSKEAIVATLESTRSIAEQLESGDGLLPTLLRDPGLAADLESSAGRLRQLLEQAQSGEGPLAMLLNDAESGEILRRTLADLSQSAGDLATVSQRVAEGRGLLQRLIEDEELGASLSEDLQLLLRDLRLLSGRLERGEGTLGQLLNDPSVYEAINDVIVGIDESALLRWLVRNRQKAGIEKRYEEEASESEYPEPAPTD